jgi:hypothetical protein
MPRRVIDSASRVRNPLANCPRCGSARLDTVIESFVGEVHFLCAGCGRCWDVAFGSVQLVVPQACLGCPSRGRCERVFVEDHPEVTSV